MIAMLPGSFDPPTLGHIDIIERSAKMYGSLHVVVAHNKDKKTLFTAAERVDMLQEIFKDYDNIKIALHNGLIVDYAKKNNIKIMIRGVRALVDFGYEFELAMTNKQLFEELEVLFLPTSPNYFLLRSSAIKELASYGANISTMVPPVVAKKLKERFDD